MKKPQDTSRLGRRSGPNTTRNDVLQAAQTRFAQDGFSATSIRKVAADAGVDPALVMQFYKSKDGLFAASLALSYEVQDRIAAAFDGPKERLGESLTQTFLSLWEESSDTEALMATLRGATSNDFAAEQLREFVQVRLLSVIGPKFGDGQESARRVGVVISMLMGLVLTRDMIGIPLVKSLSRNEIATMIGPSIQSILEGQ
ncbi:TetR family transcriptional regulator [Falsihalocynthiibacter sp. S25ZX9]|uniref:TetR/AcrR family transcriptional regulator n=1 Tax=unclassified Falsihalocynthiibacter TaxID=2854191 RepID=UPI00350FA9E4